MDYLCRVSIYIYFYWMVKGKIKVKVFYAITVSSAINYCIMYLYTKWTLIWFSKKTHNSPLRILVIIYVCFNILSNQKKWKIVENSGKKEKRIKTFILYRNDLRKRTPKNIKMTKLSKIASDTWKTMPENQKVYWRRLYEINRDLPRRNKSYHNNDLRKTRILIYYGKKGQKMERENFIKSCQIQLTRRQITHISI